MLEQDVYFSLSRSNLLCCFSPCLPMSLTEVYSRAEKSPQGGEGGNSSCHGDGAEVLHSAL